MEVTEVYALATLLDSRFRKVGFSWQVKAEAIATLLRQKVDEIKQINTQESVADLQVADEEDDWANTSDSERGDY